jgi:hypothetical protein
VKGGMEMGELVSNPGNLQDTVTVTVTRLSAELEKH